MKFDCLYGQAKLEPFTNNCYVWGGIILEKFGLPLDSNIDFQKYKQIWTQIYGVWPFVAEDFMENPFIFKDDMLLTGFHES